MNIMYKIILQALALLLSLVILHSCNKDSKIIPEDSNITNEYTADEMALWNKLNNFNLKIKNGLKSEEFISPDSAIWYLEALFNVQQATDTTFDKVRTYERTYELNVNTNGTVNMSDVVTIYNQLVNDLNAELELIDSDYKFLIIADLKEEPLKAGSFTMTLTGGLGYSRLSLYEPITNTDNWRSGNSKGRCTNTAYDSDAGQELLKRFNNPRFELVTPTYSWIDNYATDNLTYEDYPNRIFHENAPSEPCVEYTELQHYLTEGHYIIYNSPTDTPNGSRPAGLKFKMIQLWTNNDFPPDNEYLHYYKIFYGTPVSVPPID